MSLDRSLKSANALIRHRNVLTRAERLDMLKEQEKWSEDKNGIFGLPKVAHRKAAVIKSVKEEAGDGATTTAGVAPAAAGKGAPAAAGKGAPAAAAGAKGAAAPSAGGKATAPAAGKAAPAAKKK